MLKKSCAAPHRTEEWERVNNISVDMNMSKAGRGWHALGTRSEQRFHCSPWWGNCTPAAHAEQQWTRNPPCGSWRITHWSRWMCPEGSCSLWKTHAGAGFPYTEAEEVWGRHIKYKELGIDCKTYSPSFCTTWGRQLKSWEYRWAWEEGRDEGKVFLGLFLFVIILLYL